MRIVVLIWIWADDVDWTVSLSFAQGEKVLMSELQTLSGYSGNQT